MLPSESNGIINSPSIFPLANTLSICLLTILGTKILVIFVKSLISFLEKATSALFNKKFEPKKDFIDKNKFNLDKLIMLFLIKTFGFFNFTTRFKSVGLRCIFVLLNSNFTFRFTSLALFLIIVSNLSVSIPK